MKRFFTLALTLLLICALAAPAFADIAYEPNDSFFKSHYSACDYENRNYYANGASGCVLAYAAPDGKADAALPNGVLYHVYYTYEGEWGYVEYDPADPGSRETCENYVSGWVKMSDMTAEYDHAAFLADHAGELRRSERYFTVEADETFYAYKYPGSGRVTEALEGKWFGSEPIPVESEFTDPAGRDWGYIGYWRGMRQMWLCLDDLQNDSLAPDENCVTPQLVPAASAEEMAAALEDAPGGGQSAYLYAGAAGVVIIAAAVLFVTLRKKKRG